MILVISILQQLGAMRRCWRGIETTLSQSPTYKPALQQPLQSDAPHHASILSMWMDQSRRSRAS
jgi:hypothetical protein